MKVQIRQGVFETNSSSTHAISIMPYNIHGLNIPKSVHFGLNGEFGWEETTYTDVNAKASYFWIGVCSQYEDYEDRGKIAEIKNQIKQLLKTVGVEDVTFDDGKYKVAEFNGEKSTFLTFHGYVDHVYDLYELVNNLIDNGEMFLSYLFDNRSTVETGNDNSDYEPSYVDGAEWTYWKGN